MDARLLPVGTVAAALAGAALAVVLVGGPMWLLIPGLLGATLPAAFSRARHRRLGRPGTIARPQAPVDAG